MNILRATIAVWSFSALVLLQNPLQECWLGWDLPRWLDFVVVAVVYSIAFMMAGIFPTLMIDREDGLKGFQEATSAAAKS